MKIIMVRRVTPAVVPCNGCRACCHHDRVWLHPELGDKVSDHKGNVMLDSHGRYFLKWKDDSDWCIYANDQGCSLFGDPRRPAICVELDCRRLLNMSAADRKFVGKETLAAARRLIKEEEERKASQ